MRLAEDSNKIVMGEKEADYAKLGWLRGTRVRRKRRKLFLEII